jgi:hypothetical protein
LEGGVWLVPAPNPSPLSGFVAAAFAEGRRVLQVGGPRPAVPAEWWPKRAEVDAIAAWWRAAPGGSAVVAWEGAIVGLSAERPEDRMLRLVRACPPCPGNLLVLVGEVDGARLRAPSGSAARLLAQTDRVVGGPGRSQAVAWADRARALTASLAWALLSLAATTLLAFVLCAPGMVDGRALLGDAHGDLGSSLWADWWAHRWWETGGRLLRTDLLQWPFGVALPAVVRGVGSYLLAVPLVAWLGFPDFWNPLTVLSMGLAGLGAATLARQVGVDRIGALVAGLAFTGSPPLLDAVRGGSQALVMVFVVPVGVALCLRALAGSRLDGLLAGLAIAAVAVVWWFHAVFVVLFVAPLVVERWLRVPDDRPEFASRLGWAARGALPAAVVMLRVAPDRNPSDTGGRSWAELPDGFGDAPAALAWFRDAARHSLFSAGSGWLMGALGLAVAVYWLWTDGRRHAYWLLVAGVATVLAAGFWLPPDLNPAGRWVPLPLAWLEAVAPPAAAVAHPDRFLFVAALSIAVLCGHLVQRLPPAGRLLAAVAALACCILGNRVDGRLPLPTFTWDPPAWTEALDQPGAIIHLPLGMSEASALWQPAHGQPVTGGLGEVSAFASSTPYRRAFESRPELAPFWEPGRSRLDADTLATLFSHGARYVLVWDEALAIAARRPEGWKLPILADTVDAALGPAMYQGGGVRLYRIPEPAP